MTETVTEWFSEALYGIRPDKALVIAGPPASGKSTVLRLIQAAMPGAEIAYAGYDGSAEYLATTSDFLVFHEGFDDNDVIKHLLTTERVDIGGVMCDVITSVIVLTTDPKIPFDSRQMIYTTPLRAINELVPFLAR